MKNLKKIGILSFCISTLIFSGQNLSAQNWGYKPNKQGIILFSAKDFGGEQRMINSDIPDLNMVEFNDKAKSIVAYGRWEACTDAFFRGKCTIYEGENRQLGDLHTRISSLRFLGNVSYKPPYNKDKFKGQVIRGANTFFYPGTVMGWDNNSKDADNFCKNQGHNRAVYFGGNNNGMSQLEDVLCK